ncbi:MAG: hypothetical protein B6D53_03200 [Candidatus Omnitrophica bacterium 4484_49]|nr:UDP-2,3-diacylglucosamine diphosphatase LpxI [Candidatus Omnitrophota bacterium]OQX83059.1 MAG: hypothetical protein B6D53_03200 [Candidatus Omnitrophica bacterium 4484_49]
MSVSSRDKLGIIAGGTIYPVLVAQGAKARGYQIYAVGIEGLTLPEIEKYTHKVCWINMGNLQKLIEFFRENGIKELIMAGNVRKADLFKKLKLDPLTAKLFQGLSDKSDMNLLQVFAKELERNGLSLLDARTFLDEYIPKRGALTKLSPTKSQWEDILFGWKVAKTLASFDIGLTVVVKDKVVIALEGIEGTDETIKRAGDLTAGGFVVVKVARPHQDLRFELPVVGLNTVKLLVKHQASVLAIEAEKTLFFDIHQAISFANSNSLPILAL